MMMMMMIIIIIIIIMTDVLGYRDDSWGSIFCC